MYVKGRTIICLALTERAQSIWVYLGLDYLENECLQLKVNLYLDSQWSLNLTMCLSNDIFGAHCSRRKSEDSH